ncbi:hypothetical protein C8R44DRAFT_845149, partial [Mycena epipterygia]
MIGETMCTIHLVLLSPPRALCLGHPCIDMLLGLEIVQTHIEHITGIWDLVENFTFPSEAFAGASRRPRQQTTIQAVYCSALEFLRKGSTLDEDLTSALLVLCLGEMSSGGIFRNEVLDTVSKLSSPQPAQEAAKRHAPHVELDRALNKTIEELVRRTTLHHRRISRSVEHILLLADSTVKVGSQLLAGFESEILRTSQVLHHMKTEPRTQRSASRTAQFNAYLKFLEDEEHTIRALFESAAIILDNLTELGPYCAWYTDNLIIQSLNSPQCSRKHGSIKDVARSINNLLNKAEI